MSKIQVNEIVNHFDNGAPDCPRGLTISGVATATSLELTSLDVTGNVSVGGTLTYDDVTSIDSVGIITAQSGIHVGPLSGIACTITSAGAITTASYINASGNVYTGNRYANQAGGTLGSAGTLNLRCDDGSDTVSIYNGTDQKVKITTGGAATFAGDVISGGDAYNGANNGCRFYSPGQVLVSRTGGTNTVFEGYTTGNSTSTSKITAAGAITAASVITGNAFSSDAGNGNVFSTTNGKVSITAAGLVSFDSHVMTGNKPTNGTGGFLSSFGSLGLRCDDGSDFLYCHAGGNTDADRKFRLTNSGAATFAGQMTSTLAHVYGPNTTCCTFQRDTSDGTAVLFRKGSAHVGTISVTGSATSYNESSDYRLKENVVDIVDAITRIKHLQPRKFNFIIDPDTTVDGFVAHEVSSVVPEAITGEKDAMRDEEYEVTPAVEASEGVDAVPAVMGTRSVPDYQGIDKSKLVPLLTAALQEAITKIETLETKVTALEGS